ncbi:SulP family inorganic anion transporter [Costertonia aggregata]|uniref:Sulfate permease n=1 Tax=Costertonia aggregata TaxID=343403 RepID=A0A7H9ARZ1_9FLAO|nr:sulfate permease [Costertonia aggregata]QLG46152.1 sulfate permease [Costertonia aggregata]
MRNIFPFLQWLSDYKKSDFSKDIIAGFIVGIVLVPQGMAYAMIVGVPPVYGLYAALVPLVVYALLGTSRQLAVGPVAMDSLLVAAGLGTFYTVGEQNYIALVLLLALMVGVIQLLLGVLRMGFLVNFLSRPVISGFTSAAAIIIIFSQLKHLLGAPIKSDNKFHRLVLNAVDAFPQMNVYDFGIGLAGIVIIVLLKKIHKRIPSILIVVVLGLLGMYFFGSKEYGIVILGAIPSGLPSFQIPEITFENMKNIWPVALTLALVGYLEAISIGKSLEEKSGRETIDANKELLALGTSNILGSFFQSFPITASFSRSAINQQAGAKTNFAGICSVCMVLVTLLYLIPFFYYLPKAILASIIMVSVFGLIDVTYAKSLWKYRKDELLVLLVTFCITLFVGITQGILSGVLLSLLLMVYRTSKPHFAVLGNIKGSDYYKNVNRFKDELQMRDDLLIVRFDSQLYFGNSSYFKNQLLKNIHLKGKALKGVILNAEAINYIDSTAANMLIKVIKEIHEKNLQFYIAGAIGPTRDIIFSSGIVKELNKEFLFVKTKDAVAYFDDPKSISDDWHKVAYQNITQG